MIRQFFGLLYNLACRFDSSLQEPTWITVPVVYDGPEKGKTWEPMKLPILDPHRVLDFVSRRVGIKVDPDVLRHYWTTAAANGLGWATHHNDMSGVPVGIYADETKYGLQESQEKILGIFINLVLFRPRNVRLSRFLVFSIRSDLMLPGTATLYPVLNHVVWSMNWASKGVWPNKDVHGGALPAAQAAKAMSSLGARFYVTELRGDLAWHKHAWGFEKSGWQSMNTCFFCGAKSSGANTNLYYTNTGHTAAWRNTIYRDTLGWACAKLNLQKL